MTKRPKILLVEDEQHISFMLQYNLQAEGYEIVAAMNGKTALNLYQSEKPFDAIILDVNLPEVDGFQILEQIRLEDTRTGILMLTARASDQDRLVGLTSGADDYLTKPFNLLELMARVSRMIERSKLFKEQKTETKQDKFSRWSLDHDSLILKVSGQDVAHLTVLEADLLKEFLSHKDKVLSREHLLREVWGLNGDIESRTVDNFILRLRKILEVDPSNPKYLISVRGRGYKLTDPGDPK
jgi:two-component system alkaline phosphatase synthesis response regulator PhoP